MQISRFQGHFPRYFTMPSPLFAHIWGPGLCQLHYTTIYMELFKTPFSRKSRKSMWHQKGWNYLFQGFPFSRGCPCCWKESNCSSQLFFKNCFFGIFFKMQELQTKPSSFSRSIFFKTGPGQPFSRLWDGLHTKKWSFFKDQCFWLLCPSLLLWAGSEAKSDT